MCITIVLLLFLLLLLLLLDGERGGGVGGGGGERERALCYRSFSTKKEVFDSWVYDLVSGFSLGVGGRRALGGGANVG